ncbi:uncharacterized protein N7483_012627 [Penicillium malachiteum]|uniref:uncharacterized protein n=1 Tax=Penicillium malachiteum TaxID=1324776 RepID=UPI002546DC10|nr:uncharacterized protein N7483_012627 [Penicillium malachiteum]KAJ5715446.1 hypothetical protein N7483_012627 [Penicillium malachiteum]
MDVTHPSAADIMIWLGTVTKLQGESNFMQWYSDIPTVMCLIDPDVWDIMSGTFTLPKGDAVKELDACEVELKAGQEYGMQRAQTSYKMMEDWELWRVTKPRERYRRWQRNRAIARHALTLTIDPSLRHLIDEIRLPCQAFYFLCKRFVGGSPPDFS